MSKHKFNELLRTVPPLRHSLTNGEVFDINKSELIAWLITQKEVKQRLYEIATDSGCLVFDRIKKEWRGVPETVELLAHEERPTPEAPRPSGRPQKHSGAEMLAVMSSTELMTAHEIRFKMRSYPSRSTIFKLLCEAMADGKVTVAGYEAGTAKRYSLTGGAVDEDPPL